METETKLSSSIILPLNLERTRVDCLITVDVYTTT